MRQPTRRDILEFGLEMGKHAPKTTIDCLERILRYAATYGRFAEEQCNRELTESEMTKWKDRIFHALIKLCAEIDCEVRFQDDPRGATVKIKVPDGYTNDLDYEGICVPTS